MCLQKVVLLIINAYIGDNMRQILIKRFFCIVICILIASITIFFWISHKKEQIIDRSNAIGVSVEFSGPKTFFIKEDSVTYCYDMSISGVKFVRYYISVDEPGVNVKKGEVIVNIQPEGKNQNLVRGSYDDTRIVITDDGKEEPLYSGSFFVCNNEFEESSLVFTGVLDAEQDTIDAYNRVSKLVPVEDLKQYYNRALTLCNQLNE